MKRPEPTSFLRRLIGRLRFMRFHSIHLRSRRVIEAWQYKRARSIIAHAQKNVPLYADLYRQHGFSIDQFKVLADIRRLPIVNKHAFMGKDIEYCTNSTDFLRGVWATTSGTTGEPFRMLTREHFNQLMYLESVVYRALFWQIITNPDSMKIARILTKTNDRRARYFISITDVLKDPRKELRKIMAFKPRVLESFSSILHAIAQVVESEQIPFQVDYVISGGEDLSPALRVYLEKTLGCEVYNRYGMEEFAVIGMECAIHDGFHTNSESLYVEIVDEVGNPVPDGTYGRIIVTDLFNTGMPFIRYDTGDHGRMSRERCACGKDSPRVWIEGRYSAFLTFNDRRINHLEFDAALETFMNSILRYQVVKTALAEAVVKVIPGPTFGPDVERAVIQNIAAVTGPGIDICVETVDEVPKTPRGKSKIVVDLTV